MTSTDISSANKRQSANARPGPTTSLLGPISSPTASNYLLPTGTKYESQPAGLDSFLQAKLKTLDSLVQEVQGEIEDRRDLNKKILRDIGDQSLLLKDRLVPMLIWRPGYNPAADARRRMLEQQIDTLQHEQRQECVGSARDIALLLKELRIWEKQRGDLRIRLRLVASP